jgi:sugar lactone lactonase YvrE
MQSNAYTFTGTSGNTTSQFSGPVGIARDSSSGTLYIADYGNHRVMQYLTGALSGTVVVGGNGAGTGVRQLYHPRGLYFDTSTNSLLIANNYAHNIVRWTLGANSWTLVAGSASGTPGNTSTMLNYPTDVVLDSLGNMYISDEGNHRIQFFLSGQSNGTTIAGVTGIPRNSSELLYTPSSLAIDSQFNIYVTDYYNHRVQKFLHY